MRGEPVEPSMAVSDVCRLGYASDVSIAAAPKPELQHQLLHGLADPSRLVILGSLRGGERRVRDVVELTGLSQPNVSKHLACLWGCGLVAREKRGREVFYRPIEGVGELLDAVDVVLERAGETIGACPLTSETVGSASTPSAGVLR